ncbi:MAG: hypothetical protein ACJ74W_17450 [Pyrinomonadaceae bacterium]
MAMQEQLQWTTPAPLWGAAAEGATFTARRGALMRPALLRFASDNFMDDFLALMQNDPARLGELVAKPETWRGPTPPGAPVVSVPKFLQALTRKRLAAQRQQAAGTALSGPPGQTLPAQQSFAPLKIYQPAHQRYYLLAACLVCARAGLPDRAVNPGRQERVGFVVRRLLPKDYKTAAHDARGLPIPLPAPDETWDEYALVTTADGHGWRNVKAVTGQSAVSLLEGEELLPLFPVNYTQDDGHKRRVHAGLVPVGKREAYMGAGLLPPPKKTGAGASGATGGAESVDEPPVDPRMMPLWLQVTEPWKRVIERADAQRTTQSTTEPNLTEDPMPAGDLAKWLKQTREQFQTSSWYILLDFAQYLKEQLPDLWQAISSANPASAANSLPPARKAVFNALNTTLLPPALSSELSQPSRYQGKVQSSLVAALKAVTTPSLAGQLEQVAGSYDRENPDPLWPTFLFPFGDQTLAATANPLPNITLNPIAGEKPIDTAIRKIDALAKLIEQALPKQEQMLPASALPLVAQKPLDMREGWFVLRCVYDRPECGPLDPPLVSAPTAPFQMAGFFDPDAPARPIRIALPIDISPAGLRKFDKNAAFMMSDMLCGQVQRMKGITLGDLVLSVLPWPLHKDISVPDGGPCTGDGLQVGMICSLSIPIITICALLLLFVIVFLLNIIFSWLPYFFICFPLPGLSAGKKVNL